MIASVFRCALILGLAAVLLTAVPSCAPARSPQSVAAAELHDIGEAAEALFDAAWAGDWTTAGRQVAALQRSSRRDPLIDALLKRLEASTATRDRFAVLKIANELTRVAVERTPEHPGGPPRSISWLDVHGRSLRVAVDEGDAVQTTAASVEIQRAWDLARPRVVARGGEKEAAEVDATVGRITKGAPVDEMGRLAAELLEQVDELEHVFER